MNQTTFRIQMLDTEWLLQERCWSVWPLEFAVCNSLQYCIKIDITEWQMMENYLSLPLHYANLYEFPQLHTIKATRLEAIFSDDFGGIYSIKKQHFCNWSIDWFRFLVAYFRQIFSHPNVVFYWLLQLLTIKFQWTKATD